MESPDTFVVRKADLSIVARQIGPKLRMTVTVLGGTREIDVPEHDRNRPSVSDAQCLDAVRLAITLEARLLLADDWTDPTHTLPALAPLFAGDFFVFTGGGDVYSEEEVHAWLNESGWRPVGFTPLAGPHSVIIAETPPEQVIALRGFQASQGVVARDWLSQRKGWR